MKFRPLISKVLGPPAILFLALVVCNVAYQLIWGTIDASRRKKQSAIIVEDFHLRMNNGFFFGGCDEENSMYTSNRDCSAQLVRSLYGKFKHVKAAQFQAVSEPRWVVVDCVSEFEKGEVKEKFLLNGDPDRGMQIVLYLPKNETSQKIGE